MAMYSGAPILTAQQMRAAERQAETDGTPLATLMDRAGAALADCAWRMAAGKPVTILCGPGNNGGDGYVAARLLRERGAAVSVVTIAEPATELARAAAHNWAGPVKALSSEVTHGGILVDCLFGTGLKRALAPDVAALLRAHSASAHRTIAADLPSGVGTDNGTLLGCPYTADVTLALGALKPAHLLFPAAAHCGDVRLDTLGIKATAAAHVASMPNLPLPGPGDHKYTRGLVAVVAGSMPGAAELVARGALRGGAGYVRLLGSSLPPSAPHAIVRQSRIDAGSFGDKRLAAIIVGSGLGRGEEAQRRFDLAMAAGRPMVIDGDALALVDGALAVPAIMTPHAGEFERLWGDQGGSKIDRTLAAAAHFSAVIVNKGADSVVAAPDGRAAIRSPGYPWLSTAGTGDVLAGLCGAMLARGLPAFEAAQAAILIHDRVARAVGPMLCADDLVARPLPAP